MTVGLVPPYRALPSTTETLRAEVRGFLEADRAEHCWLPRIGLGVRHRDERPRRTDKLMSGASEERRLE